MKYYGVTTVCIVDGRFFALQDREKKAAKLPPAEVNKSGDNYFLTCYYETLEEAESVVASFNDENF